MNLLELRAGIATTLSNASALVDVNIYTHEGEFKIEDLRRYARKTPAVIVSVAGFDGTQDPIVSRAGARASCVLVIFTENRPQDPKGDGALTLATKVYRELVKGQFFGLETNSVPKNVKGRNYFSTGLDKLGATLWAITFDMDVDLYDDSESFDDLELIYTEYDLGPEPDDVIEAVDQIDTT